MPYQNAIDNATNSAGCATCDARNHQSRRRRTATRPAPMRALIRTRSPNRTSRATRCRQRPSPGRRSLVNRSADRVVTTRVHDSRRRSEAVRDLEACRRPIVERGAAVLAGCRERRVSAQRNVERAVGVPRREPAGRHRALHLSQGSDEGRRIFGCVKPVRAAQAKRGTTDRPHRRCCDHRVRHHMAGSVVRRVMALRAETRVSEADMVVRARRGRNGSRRRAQP